MLSNKSEGEPNQDDELYFNACWHSITDKLVTHTQPLKLAYRFSPTIQVEAHP